jgi:hypothetical protein
MSILAIAYALMLFAVCMESITVWLLLLFFAYELEWIRVIPAAFRELSTADKWWFLACMFTMGLIADELRLLRLAWRERKRVAPRSESGNCTAQEFIETARRIPHS